ncbi:MAG: SCO family protein [Candidatus Thermoplasmatota archaeon]|nr:SCO family protein [Candidatus Thermoplasmatota archaeon]
MSAGVRAAILALSFLLAGCIGPEGTGIIGTEYRNPPDAPDFTLKNQFGEDVSLSDFDGKVVVVAFIYTACPDVCLIISSNIDYVSQNLGSESDFVEFISITIDPARDTTQRLLEWTTARGYEWNHLTHDRGSVIQAVWDEWKVVVDADHIANSLPPEKAMLRFVVMGPDNSTVVTDNSCIDAFNVSCYGNGGELAEYALTVNAEMDYDMNNGTIGDWTADDSWEWVLHIWNDSTETWDSTDASISEIEIEFDTHLAWIASNANLSTMPPGADCNGRGWVMGTGASAHCMCDDGWDRGSDDWMSCVPEGSTEVYDGNLTGPHEESLGEYEIGHSTVTFIIDKEQRKRVAYSGIHWSVEDFLQDVKALAEE